MWCTHTHTPPTSSLLYGERTSHIHTHTQEANKDGGAVRGAIPEKILIPIPIPGFILKLRTHSQLTQSPFTGTDCLFSYISFKTTLLTKYSIYEINFSQFMKIEKKIKLTFSFMLMQRPLHCLLNFHFFFCLRCMFFFSKTFFYFMLHCI